MSGGLFTLSIHIRPKGEFLAWGVFAGLAFVGWIASLFICGDGLESKDWHKIDADDDEEQ